MQQDALFSDFPRKNHNSHAHILSTKRPFSKKHTLLSCPYFVKKHSFSKNHDALMPIFSQKNVHSLEKLCSYVVFFLIFHKKPPAVMPILGPNARLRRGWGRVITGPRREKKASRSGEFVRFEKQRQVILDFQFFYIFFPKIAFFRQFFLKLSSISTSRRGHL